jgi:hypothetical protein
MSDSRASNAVTRRQLVAGGVALSSASMLATREAFADSPKVSKDCVHFKEASDDEKVCGNCRLFRKPSTCLVVAGDFSKQNTCRIWLQRI